MPSVRERGGIYGRRKKRLLKWTAEVGNGVVEKGSREVKKWRV